MTTSVGIRELAKNASRIVEQVEGTRQPVLITRRGKPIAALVVIDQDALEDFILANVSEFIGDMARADDALASGDTRTLEDVMRDISDDDR